MNDGRHWPQNGYGVYKKNLKSLALWKAGTGRHSLDDYADLGAEVES